jgi:hypothetical protein
LPTAGFNGGVLQIIQRKAENDLINILDNIEACNKALKVVLLLTLSV